MSRFLSSPRLALTLLLVELVGLWSCFVVERYVWGIGVVGLLWLHPPLALLGAWRGHALLRQGRIEAPRQRLYLVVTGLALVHLGLHTILAVNTDFTF